MEDQDAAKLLEVVRGIGGAPQSTIIGFGDRTAPVWAGFVNGSLIHGCEFDDVYTERILHTEGFAVPVALALAEQRGHSGWAMIEGWLVTAELALRAAWGCAEDSLNHTGFHNTAIFGTIGSAAGAGRMLGLDADQIASAIALSVSFAAGTNQGANEATGRNKSIQPGWAAHGGLMAAQLAGAGYACAHSTLDGPRGLYASHASTCSSPSPCTPTALSPTRSARRSDRCRPRRRPTCRPSWCTGRAPPSVQRRGRV
jgi:2-methylcitrate dehydratase PrpD